MSILFPLQKEWLLFDKPCTRLYDPLPVTFSESTAAFLSGHNSVSMSVCMYVYDGGFGGWGRERPMKQRVTTTVSTPARCTNQDLISTKHRSRPKGRNDGRIASLSHRTRGGYKNLPLPPATERTGGYMEERVFRNFQNFWEPRFKMSELGFWVFSPPSSKGINTRTDNMRVHMAGSDTRTTSVGTTALSHNIVFIRGDINALGWDPWVLFWENFELWRPNRAFEVARVA
jgi:hypothetical protein